MTKQRLLSLPTIWSRPEKGRACVGQLTWLTCPPATELASASVFCSMQDRRSFHLLCSCAVQGWTLLLHLCRILHDGNRRRASRCPACGWSRVLPSPSLRRCVRSTENANLKRRRRESHQCSAADYYEAALIDVSVDTTPNVTIHNCGTLSAQCQYCSAKFFIGERLSKSTTGILKFGICCRAGKIKLWAVRHTPEPFAHLYVLWV